MSMDIAVRILKSLGIMNIETATDGLKAWDIYCQNDGDIDLIISDWNMPRMSGFDLLNRIREVDAKTPFLMLTAQNVGESVLSAKEAGVNTYISKPYSAQKLIDTIKSLLSPEF